MANMAAPTTEADKYDVLEKIGHGSFGVIRKVKRKSDGKIMCRKEINYMKMSKSERDQLQREFSILSSLQHENIVTYYHRDHIKAAQELHIYMEYCGGGDLSRKIRDLATARQHAPEEYVWDVLAQINSALYRCHYGEDPPPVGTNVLAPPHSPKKLRSKTQVTILHRDLKPENIFLGDDDSVKLGDFGLSKAIASHDLASTYVGTPYYMSPEICAAERYGWHSDIWALGCIIYELCQGRQPFDAKTHFHLVQKIKDGRFDPLPSVYSDDLRSIVNSCLQVNPLKRPTTRDIINLPVVRLMRKQREMVQLNRVLKEKESVMRQKVAEAEALLARSNAERLQQAEDLKQQLTTKIRAEVRLEIDSSLRREWEVRARLEIDKHSQQEQERLQKIFHSEFDKRVQAEAAQQVEAIKKSLHDQSAGSSQNTVPPLTSSSTTRTVDSPPTDLSAMSFDSPAVKLHPPQIKKPARTPFSRARTQVDSPMDVQMTSPSPICASLSLSPRRAAALASGTGGQNLFTANALANAQAGRERWQPQLMSDLNTDDEEEEDELPELPSPSSPTRALCRPSATMLSGDPFKSAVPVKRPGFRRQSTMPVNTLAAQPAIFNSKGIASQGKPSSPTSPTRQIRSQLAKASTTVGNTGGDDMFKAVTQRNMLSAGGPNTSGTTGRTLVELNQAKSAPLVSAPQWSPAELPKKEAENQEVAVWDPETEPEMPSPFLARKGRGFLSA